MTEPQITEASPYDLIICGAGMAGASLACALINTSLKIAIVEVQQPDFGAHPGFDSRAIALSHGSLEILNEIGIGKEIAMHGTAIHDIHISDRGHFGLCQLKHKDYQIKELGSVIELQDAGRVLHQRLATAENIDLFCPDSPNHIEQHQEQVTVTLQSGLCLTAKLLVAADGSHSKVKSLLNIKSSKHDFQQAAVIANVCSTQEHNNTAYERFTDSGPIALLPLSKQRWSLVWTINESQVQEFSRLNDKEFLNQLQQRFGHRVGRFIQTGKRDIYPLHLIEAKQAINHRVILLGNAAHQLHPIAGQGYNLGLRDVMALANIIKAAIDAKQDIGCFTPLNNYKKQRQEDTQNTIKITTSLVSFFSSQQPAITLCRNLSLNILQCMPQIKDRFAWKMMGK